MQLHINIHKRIKSIKSFKETIDEINILDDLLMPALLERSKYPICNDFFGHYKGTSQRELEEKEIDTIGWKILYHPIVRKICKAGNYQEGVIETEARLEALAYERIMIGEKVVAHKAPRGMEITRPDKEKEVIRGAKERAESYSLPPNKIAQVFRILMEQNKHIQRMHKKDNPGLNLVREMSTTLPDPYKPGNGNNLDIIKRLLQTDAKLLEERTGEKHFVVVEQMGENPLPKYRVRLVKE